VFLNSSPDTYTAPSHEKVWSVITEITYLSCQVAIQTPFPAHVTTNISWSFLVGPSFCMIHCDCLRIKIYETCWTYSSEEVQMFPCFKNYYRLIHLFSSTSRDFLFSEKGTGGYLLFISVILSDYYCKVWSRFDDDISHCLKLLFWTSSINGVLKPVHFGNVYFSLTTAQHRRFSHMKAEIKQTSET
jgi:hypothetical protein